MYAGISRHNLPSLLQCFSASHTFSRLPCTLTDTSKHKHAVYTKICMLILLSELFHLLVHPLVSVVSPVSPLIVVSPPGTHPSWLSLPSISASDCEPGEMSWQSAEHLVQGFITSSMPSQFPFNVFAQTGSVKFLSELHGQSSVRLRKPSMKRTRFQTHREKKTDRQTQSQRQRQFLLIDSSWESERKHRHSLTAKIYTHTLRIEGGGDWEKDVAEVQQGGRRRLWQKMRSKAEMNGDKASKQTEADEQMMTDDRQQDTRGRERETALSERVNKLHSSTLIIHQPWS